MASYQIDKLNAADGSAAVLFTADNGQQFTEVVGELPLHDAVATKEVLAEHLGKWQKRLNDNEQESVPDDPPLDPALESILHMQQTPKTDDFGQIILPEITALDTNISEETKTNG